MKNPRVIICFVAAMLFLGACPTLGVVEFKDGLPHDIDYIIADTVCVDEEAPLMYTTVNLLPGGRITADLVGFKDSLININGGTVDGYIDINEYSQLSVSSGLLGIITTDGYAQMDISGGSIGHSVFCRGFSQASITGGSVLHSIASSEFSQVIFSGGALEGFLDSGGRGTITIVGYDFAIDGQSVGYGELTSILGGLPEDEPWRHLTGTLASGEPIDNDFRIAEYAKIILIPEPATIALLSIGGIAVIRRRRW